MNLSIDIGNTRIKAAVFKANTIVYQSAFPQEDFLSEIKKSLENFAITDVIVSSVGRLKPNQLEFLQENLCVYTLNSDTKLPFSNKYTTPKTLGVDRIALVAAAVTQFPNQNVLVFDAGTCITSDFVNDKKEYFGGAISPGIEMRYKALHNFTASLPKLSRTDTIPQQGNSTENAIHLGVLNGMVQEIQGIISQYKENYKKLTIVLTGGDTIFLAKNIKSTIFANPNFLLEGLNSILTYNKDE
jgi:type III pantothenate kinase